VQDDAAQAFLARCLAPPEQRPSAQELLEDVFLQPPRKATAPASSTDQELIKSRSDIEHLQSSAPQDEASLRGGRPPSLPGSDDEPAACEAGTGGAIDACSCG
jgi:serine/threonine protein kinase